MNRMLLIPMPAQPKQVGLKPDHALVAAAAVQYGFDADLLLNRDGGGERTDAGAGARTVRQIDRVDSHLFAFAGAGDGGGKVGRAAV